MTFKRYLLLGSILIIFFLGYFLIDPSWLTIEAIQGYRHQITSLYTQHPTILSFAYFIVYVMTTTLSLPFATPLTLLGGAILGFGWGVFWVSFASSLGATLAFLISRYLFRDLLLNRYGDALSTFNDGLEKDGGFYLFAMRLVPVFPFFLINILAGLSPMPVRVFYVVSQLAMLPGTMVYVYAGQALGTLQSFSDIGSPSLIFAFVLLGIFPLLAKKTLLYFRR